MIQDFTKTYYQFISRYFTFQLLQQPISKMDIAINPLKRIVKSTFNRDPLQEIFWGTPTADSYLKAINSYRTLPPEIRQQTIARCLKKLYKPKEAELIIANLALLQKIMKIDFIYLPLKEPDVIQSSKKKEISMAEKKFVKFYFQFIKMQELQLPNKMVTIDDKLKFCQIGLNKCLSIINNNIIIDYCINHSPNQITLRIALKEIFEDCRKDLESANSLIDAHAKMIYEQCNQISFAINEIYETLIFVSKNIHKISVLVKKAGLGINLPVYQMNKDLNLKIEMQMNSRKDEKTKFKTEKHIKSRKNIEYEQGLYSQAQSSNKKMQRGFQSLSEIDQDDILIQSEGLL